MADIELVIKIPEETYKDIQSRDWKNGGRWYSEEWNAIHNGIALPKGHGRLIDADELKRIIQGNDVLNMTGFNVRICDINATPTIIEADNTERSEE